MSYASMPYVPYKRKFKCYMVLVIPTKKEEGCIEYKLHQDNEDPAVFIFYETWENLVCLEKHMNTDHFKSYAAMVDNMLIEKIVYKMTRIE